MAEYMRGWDNTHGSSPWARKLRKGGVVMIVYMFDCRRLLRPLLNRPPIEETDRMCLKALGERRENRLPYYTAGFK